ncbi:DUF882 domain-containing protein [Moritella sp. 24]|uniref:DUF882 domain-containing protein n=1 Tax=Moritella sp. 24 TaxID=2746230 RepID=UPI001BADA6D8|nr:DUF882 domain-containing protein [Moritella sp. 24]QUM76616.1 DUF882 domain-containing protein [Moritella sp. 24]
MSIVCPTRRKVLLGLGGLAACSVASVKVQASQSVLGVKELGFYNIHTQERDQGRFWIDGLYQEDTLDSFSQLLRDHRQNLSAPMDRRLYELLYQLNKTLNISEEFHVISGYRSPKTNQMLASKSNAVATKSYHMRGMAIDIAIPDVKLSHLREAAISLKLGGVGYYPKSGFIHVDTGPVRIW